MYEMEVLWDLLWEQDDEKHKAVGPMCNDLFSHVISGCCRIIDALLLDASAIDGDDEDRLEYIHMFEYGGLVGSVVGPVERGS